jgi:hypothetical protein
MKKQLFLIGLSVMLLLIPGALWAGNQPGVSQDTPAILVSLGQTNAFPLDDSAAAAVRGQAGTDYVLVKVIGLNTLDGGAGLKWTFNPLGYRYGYWGGPGWSGSDVNLYADGKYGMDYFFMLHDTVYSNPNATAADKSFADNALLAALSSLPNKPGGFWPGQVYIPDSQPIGLTPNLNVSVFGISLIGGKVFLGWRDMPYTEYSRREAVYGMQLMILGKSVLRLN